MFVPIVHHNRCAAWDRLRPDSASESQTALRHAMWTLAASSSTTTSSSFSTTQGVMFPTSPFGECIVVATAAGHALSHRLRASVDTATTTKTTGSRDTLAQDTTHAAHDFDFWDRHAWLEALVAHGIGAFALLHPPATQERDPMLLFLAMVWQTIVLYLWHTAESFPAPARDRDPAVSAVASQRVDKAAHEMLHLMSRLSELNSWKARLVISLSPPPQLLSSHCFPSFRSGVVFLIFAYSGYTQQIHPLMNIPLALCVELLVPRPDLMEPFAQKLKEITQATHGLKDFSSLGPQV